MLPKCIKVALNIKQYNVTSTKSTEIKKITTKNLIQAKRQASIAFQGYGWQTIKLSDTSNNLIATKYTTNQRWKKYTYIRIR